MPKQLLTTYHLPVIAAGGIMVISLFVLLVCSLAVDGLTGKDVLQISKPVLHRLTTDKLFRGLDEITSDVAVTLHGDEQYPCIVIDHPVRLQKCHFACCP